jgi:L-Ala-D/L-Glu epimerase / N-acetyl-D-glutamate racemase
MNYKIKDIKAEPLNLPLEEPFRIATGVKYSAENVLVRIYMENGLIGYGESCNSTYTLGETQETIIAVIKALADDIKGQDIRRYRTIINNIKNKMRFNTGAKSAIEIAILDAFTRCFEMPLYQFFGGALTDVETDMTIGIVDPDHAFELGEKFTEQGFNVLKIKVGGDIDQDFDRVVRAAEGAPDCEITLDANQGYKPKEAISITNALLEAGINLTMLEQPVHKEDFAGMRFVRENCPVDVAADETVYTVANAIRVVKEEAADAINIKVAKVGMLGAMDVIGIGKAANLKLMLGGMAESKIGLAGSVHLACGTGVFSYLDLDTVFLLKPFECQGGFEINGPVFNVADIKSGTGIEYNPE